MSFEDKSTSGALPVLSRYDSSLSADVKRRFLQKIALLDGYDLLIASSTVLACCGKGSLEIKCPYNIVA